MNNRYKYLLLTLLMCFAFSNFIAAQSPFSDHNSGKKYKRSPLLMGDVLKKVKMPSLAMMKAYTDNDIASWVEQAYEGENWVDDTRAIYEYNQSRTVITIHYEGLEDGEWVESETETIKMDAEGYPLELSFSWQDIEIAQVIHYADQETVKIDSITYTESYPDGEDYFSRLEFEYVTDDSIRIVEYEREGQSEEVIYSTGYFANRGDDFVESYDYEAEGYRDRYLYTDASFNDFLKNIANEFFFVEIYNDEYSYDTEEWAPYSRTTLTVEGGNVTEELYEIFDSEWLDETNRLISYSDGKVSSIVEEYYGSTWVNAYRTNYTYGAVVSNEEEVGMIEGFELSQNYPNPFNPTTQINYAIPNAGEVSLEVFNMLGHKVATLANGNKVAGAHTATFNAGNFSSGIYYYKLRYAGVEQVKSMTLIK